MSDNSPNGEQCLLVRFDFFRDPGVKASCIGMVRDIDPFNWFKADFYVATSMPGLQTMVECFALTQKSYAVQRLLFDGLANVDFLVCRSGERAAFPVRDAPLVDNIIRQAVPLFDEHGIIKAIETEPHLGNILVASNTFGTWGDTSLHKLCAQIGVDFCWKRVGTNGDLLPLQSKRIVIKQSLELESKGQSARKPTRTFALEE